MVARHISGREQSINLKSTFVNGGTLDVNWECYQPAKRKFFLGYFGQVKDEGAQLGTVD